MDQAQFADQLFALEKLHLTKLLLWAGVSVLAGSLVFVLLFVRRLESSLLKHFAIQCGAWGLVEIAYAGWSRNEVVMRDLAGATQLDQHLWFNIGLDAGIVAVGVALAIVGWRLGRHLRLVGAGLGIAVQGLALALLNLQLSAGIVR